MEREPLERELDAARDELVSLAPDLWEMCGYASPDLLSIRRLRREANVARCRVAFKAIIAFDGVNA